MFPPEAQHSAGNPKPVPEFRKGFGKKQSEYDFRLTDEIGKNITYCNWQDE